MNKPICNRFYIYYTMRALCIKAWSHHCRPNKIYELEKCYAYKDIDTGYVVNSYKLKSTNEDGIDCFLMLDEKAFDKYFVEIPGTYKERNI